MNNLSDWSTEHRANWLRRAPVIPDGFPMPRPIFGKEDADEEWMHSGSPHELFAPIESYSELRPEGALYLFGRRGTGKTAILRMLDYRVNSSKDPIYHLSQIIHPKKVVTTITRHTRDWLQTLTFKEQVDFGEKCWLYLIRMAAILKAYQSGMIDNPRSLRTLGNDRYIRRLSSPARVTVAITQALSKILVRNFRTSSRARFAEALLKTETQLESEAIDLDLERLSNLSEHKGKFSLVLVDTDEAYDIKDPLTKALQTALLESALTIYTRRSEDGLLAKVAFPSEVLPHIDPHNREKTEGKNVFIVWRYRDLVTFIAKRFLRAQGHQLAMVSYSKMNDYVSAKEYLNTFFPANIRTRTNLTFDTLAYVVRHTQKKPRQLIFLLNAIATTGTRSNFSPLDSFSNPEVVRNGVHVRLDILFSGAMDMYKDLYPEATKIVRAALTEARCYFLPAELDRMLHSTNPFRNALTKEEVKRLLLESGVLGIGQSVHKLGQDHWILEAMYEYQIKETLTITPGSLCVVHPMCYEELRTLVDPSTFVYPHPFEAEEGLVIEGLRA